MKRLGLDTAIVDEHVYGRAVRRARDVGAVLPTFAQLADPTLIPPSIRVAVDGIPADEVHPLNLFRVHWYNDASRQRQARVPDHLVLPPALTGVDASIIVALGNRFPMIRTHKVLAAYACLAPRIVTGQFDPTAHKALWPSTGNYCRGGVAISRIMGCRGVAILPAGMSEERFRWLETWVADPNDIIRTPGSESNVKEIYDACARLERDPANIVFNQFCEFGNYLAHYTCTGPALAHVFDDVHSRHPQLTLRAVVAATVRWQVRLGRRRGGVLGAHARRVRRSPADVVGARPTADLQSGLLHLGRAARHFAGGLYRTTRAAVLARAARSSADMGRDDRRIQRASRSLPARRVTVNAPPA
jgi:cysteine synthase